MSYKPVKGYCVLYPEEIRVLASQGLGKRSCYASAPRWAVYLALRQRAYAKKEEWWKTFVSYEWIAQDLGWELNDSTRKSIERSLKELRLMGMIVYVKGRRGTAMKAGVANDYRLVLYKRLREEYEASGKRTPTSETRTPTSQLRTPTSETSDTSVALKRKGKKKNKKHSIIQNEKQEALEEAFQAFMTEEASEENTYFSDFMNALEAGETTKTLRNNVTNEMEAVTDIIDRVLSSEDWSFLLEEFDVEDIREVTKRMNRKHVFIYPIESTVSRLLVGASDIKTELAKLRKTTK
jgi:hypothetical protein